MPRNRRVTFRQNYSLVQRALTRSYRENEEILAENARIAKQLVDLAQRHKISSSNYALLRSAHESLRVQLAESRFESNLLRAQLKRVEKIQTSALRNVA